MQGQTKIQERLKGIQSLIHEIEGARKVSEVTINKFSQTNSPATIKQAISDSQKEEALIRQALSKIYEIHAIRNEIRIQARNSGQKEMLRKGQLMKMLQISAQTLPLYVSKPGEKIPPLVGSIPANSEYTAKSGDMVAALTKVVDKGSDEENWVSNKAKINSLNNLFSGFRSWLKSSTIHIILKNTKFMILMRSKNPDMSSAKEESFHCRCIERIQKQTLTHFSPKEQLLWRCTHKQLAFIKVRNQSVRRIKLKQNFLTAIINDLPSNAKQDYEVLFEDSTYPNGYSDPMYVAQRFVISIKQRKS